MCKHNKTHIYDHINLTLFNSTISQVKKCDTVAFALLYISRMTHRTLPLLNTKIGLTEPKSLAYTTEY